MWYLIVSILDLCPLSYFDDNKVIYKVKIKLESCHIFFHFTFTDHFKAVLLFVGHLCYVCLVFVMLSHLLIAALWSSAGNGLTSWL